MKCPYCGTNNNYYHKYCYECGYKLEQADSIEHGGIDRSLNDAGSPPLIVFSDNDHVINDATKERKTRTLYILAIAIVSVVLLVFLLIALTNRNTVDTVKSTPNAITTVLAPSQMPVGASTTPSATPTLEPLTLQIIDPATNNGQTEADQYTAIVKTNGSSLSINGQPFSGKPAENGELSLVLPIEQNGMNVFEIQVTDETGQIVSKSITIEKLLPQTLLALVEPQQLSTQEKKLTVQGTTVPGAVITLTTESQYASPIVVDASGKFSIEFTFSQIPGKYPVQMSAEADGHRPTVLTFELEKLLDEDAYKDAAVLCDYSKLVENPDTYRGKIIYFSGSIDTVDERNASRFVFKVNKKSTQKLYIEYTGETSMTAGASRRLYGEYIGEIDGMPHIVARLGFRIGSDGNAGVTQ